ncbi:MAG: ORF6N domain-containing protein [Bacteroidetes bacterium]|nr:ORF6N domain-containing protein [Bacteroidota bacterium]MCW5893992.1 ORF6N domain-containing protein [Bacteroidota bacterium]
MNRQVKRIASVFSRNSYFNSLNKETRELVTNWHRFERLKHSSTTPYVFTEHGVAMLASVLNSQRGLLQREEMP